MKWLSIDSPFYQSFSRGLCGISNYTKPPYGLCLNWKSNNSNRALLFCGWCCKVLRPGGKISDASPALCAVAVAALGLAGLWANIAKGWSSGPAEDCHEAINNLALPIWHQLLFSTVNPARVPRMDWCLVFCSVHSQGTCCLGCLYLMYHVVFLCMGRLV